MRMRSGSRDMFKIEDEGTQLNNELAESRRGELKQVQ